MCLETAREAVHARKPAPIETPCEITQAGKSTPAKKSRKNKKRKNGDRRWSLDVNNKKAKSPDQRIPRPSLSKYTKFTDLIWSREEVFLATEQTGVYKRPDLLWGDRSIRNQNKYCRCHKDVGHTTEECIMLKDEIEKLIRDGYLQDYVCNRRTKPSNDQNETEPPRKIRTIFGWPHFIGETLGAQNRYVWAAREKPLTDTDFLDKRPAK